MNNEELVKELIKGREEDRNIINKLISLQEKSIEFQEKTQVSNKEEVKDGRKSNLQNMLVMACIIIFFFFGYFFSSYSKEIKESNSNYNYNENINKNE